MTHLLLNELRHLILQKLKIQIISPSDCSYIALEINKSLHKNISVTTIKRLFGFAATNHEFSNYTISTLLAFVEDERKNPISKTVIKESSFVNVDEWEYLVLKSKSLSEITIKRIKDNCTIPFEFSINRKFATCDFDYFYHSDFCFTSFIAQEGYGKSILLAHLVDSLFLKPEAKFGNDVILFLHADTIFDLEQEKQDLTNDIAVLLGLPAKTDLVAYFTKQYNQTGHKLVLMFDGLIDILTKHGQKPRLFDSLVQLICNIEDSPAIKVVFTLRSYNWRRFFETIRHSNFIISKWFTGSYYKKRCYSNVPALTTAEVEQVLVNIDGEQKQFSNELGQKLKHPFLLRFYYQLKLEGQENNYCSSYVFHEVILSYLTLKVHQSNHAADKIMICRKLITLSDYGKKGNQISKKLLLAELILYRDSYMELLNDGILIEQLNDLDDIPTEYIHFIHDDVFEYFLFNEILELHDHKMDKGYFNYVLNEYQDQEKQNTLLQWSIFYAVKNHQFEIIKKIIWLNQNSEQHDMLMLFLADNIKYQINVNPNIIGELRQPDIHQEMIKALPYIDFTLPAYQKILSVFSEIADCKKTFITYQSALILSDCLNLDLAKLQFRKTQLRPLQDTTSQMAVDPLEVVEIMIDKLKGTEGKVYPLIIKTESLNLNEEIYDLSSSEGPGNLMSCLLLAMAFWFRDDAIQTTKIIKKMTNGTKGTFFQSSKIYTTYLLHILAFESSRIAISDEIPNQLENLLIKFHKQKQVNSYNLKLLYSVVLAMQSVRRNEYELALSYAKQGYNELNDDFLIGKLLMKYIMVKVYNTLGEVEKLNECKYAILCLLESRNVNPQIFNEALVQSLNKY